MAWMVGRALGLILICIAGAGHAQVSGPLVSCDGWPRATDLVTWTGDVMRIEGLENASETAQGRAFFEWLRLLNRMAVGGMIQAFEGEYGQEKYVTDAHKNLFVYGWGYCDTSSRIAEAAWKEFKRDPAAAERVCVQHDDGGYHTMFRLRLDGHYGAFDPRYGYYLVDRDAPGARILDWAEVGVDENLLRNRTFRHRSRPFFEIFGLEWERALLIQPAYFASEDLWRKAGAPKENVFGNSQYRMGTRFHDMDFRLPKGTEIERFWDNSARKFYVPAGRHTEREFPFLESGRFYRVTETSLGGNWPQHDPNYGRAKPYLATVPAGQGYPADLAGGRSIGQAWGVIRYRPEPGDLRLDEPLDFYSPYVLVDGTLETEPGAQLAIRTLRPKNTRESEPDVWSDWQPLAGGKIDLGRPRFNGKDVSIHGVYRFQLRLKGKPRLKLTLYFENGIMSIPRIFAGANTVRVQVRDAGLLRAPVRVTWRYQTPAGAREHAKTLEPADFRGGTAVYKLDAPGLVRCTSVAVAY